MQNLCEAIWLSSWTCTYRLPSFRRGHRLGTVNVIRFKLGVFHMKFNHMVVAFLVLIVIAVILIFRLIKITFFPPLLYSPCCKITPFHLNKTLNIFPSDSCMLLEQTLPPLNSAFDMSRNEYDPLGFIPATFLQTLSNIFCNYGRNVYILFIRHNMHSRDIL